MKIWKMLVFWDACMKALLGCSWEVLVSRSCKSFSLDYEVVRFS